MDHRHDRLLAWKVAARNLLRQLPHLRVLRLALTQLLGRSHMCWHSSAKSRARRQVPRVILDEMSLAMTGWKARKETGPCANRLHAAFRTRARLVKGQLARARRVRKWRGTRQEIDVGLRCRRNSLATAISRTPAHSPATRDRATNTTRYHGSCP